MRSRRLIVLLVVAVAGLVLVVALARVQGGAGDTVASAPPSATAATPSASAAPPSPESTASPSTGDTLQAVTTVKRFCDLVDDRALRSASRLLAGPWVWPRRELTRIARLRFVSARVQDARSANDIVLLARVRARLRGPSPLHDGVNTLFFTLGRDGTTGGWLITAVTTSP